MPRYLTDEDVYTILTAVYHHHTDIQHKALRDAINSVPTANLVEPLTDTEQRIFLAAMGREEKVCKNIDEELPGPYPDSLFKTCKEIERKVKKALWTN